MAVEILFYALAMLVAYAYVGYPLLIFVWARVLPKPVRKSDITPGVSIVIAAHNEERHIAEKLENTLALEYPTGKLEVIVASDCSDDRTDAIVSSYAHRGVSLVRVPERLGKSVAQNVAARSASGEILVFSDATTVYASDALRRIVRSFADPQVGCVAGQLIYVDSPASAVSQGCRSYWSYEKFIRESESDAGSLIGVSGCLYAVRRSSYARLALDMSSDFVVASEIRLQGQRTVYEHAAVAMELTNKDSRNEFKMRVRVIEQTLSALHRYGRPLPSEFRGLFAFQLVSHKLLRYAVPFFLMAALFLNLLLAVASTTYFVLLLLQLTFYLIATLGFVAERSNLRLRVLAIPHYFVLANAASLVGFIKFIRGQAHVIWEPVRDAR